MRKCETFGPSARIQFKPSWQRAIHDDSKEIPTIPDVLDRFSLEGALVTLDAMGTQKDIAQHIRDEKADYLLTLKANHGKAYEALEDHFNRCCFSHGAGCSGDRSKLIFDAFDDSHGRLVRRRVFACPDAAAGWDDAYMEQLLHSNLMR